MYYHLIVQTFEKCPSEQNPQKCPSNMMQDAMCSSENDAMCSTEHGAMLFCTKTFHPCTQRLSKGSPEASFYRLRYEPNKF